MVMAVVTAMGQKQTRITRENLRKIGRKGFKYPGIHSVVPSYILEGERIIL
jgi:hypothetical protein